MVAICSIFKNEALYLEEWISFHKKVGVERFYLYNNSSDDNWKEITDRHLETTVIDWPYEKPCQLSAYQDCIDRHKGQDKWIAFIDVDEFLFNPHSREGQLGLPEGNGAIGVNWRCFGSGGQEFYSSEPVRRRFVFRAPLDNPVNLHIKSIVWMNQEVKVGGDPHFFNVEHGTWHPDGQLDGPLSSTHHSDFLRINHYASKSREEWLKRKSLGTPDRKEVETPEWVWGMDRAGVFDDSILKV